MNKVSIESIEQGLWGVFRRGTAWNSVRSRPHDCAAYDALQRCKDMFGSALIFAGFGKRPMGGRCRRQVSLIQGSRFKVQGSRFKVQGSRRLPTWKPGDKFRSMYADARCICLAFT
jgi:hypothetical protein